MSDFTPGELLQLLHAVNLSLHRSTRQRDRAGLPHQRHIAGDHVATFVALKAKLEALLREAAR